MKVRIAVLAVIKIKVINNKEIIAANVKLKIAKSANTILFYVINVLEIYIY